MHNTDKINNTSCAKSADEARNNGAMLYLDAAATTYPRREVMNAVCKAPWENPSSVNKYGAGVRRSIEEIRKNIQRLLAAEARKLIFTSGGTEANNTAIYDAMHEASKRYPRGGKVLISGIDHASVDECVRKLSYEHGLEAVEMPVDRYGRIVYEEVDFSDVAVCCLTHVNNELGSIVDVRRFREALDAAAASGIIKTPPLIIIDGVQALGKLPISIVKEGVAFSDYYSISAHKIHGPKGIGALVVKKRSLHSPLHIGGSQESGQRAGTENVPGIFGMDAALRLLVTQGAHAAVGDSENSAADRIADASFAKELFVSELSRFMDAGDFVLNSPGDGCPYIVSVSLRGAKSEVMLHMLAEKGVAVSSASACSSSKDTVSRVIRRIGTPPEFADGTLRLSLAPDFFWTRPERVIRVSDIEYAAKSIADAAAEVRKYNRL